MRRRVASRRIRGATLLLTVGFLAVGGTLGGTVYCDLRKARLNRLLIASLQSNRSAQALSALQAGADPDATADEKFPATLLEWVKRLFRQETAKTATGPSALRLAVEQNDTLVAGTLLRMGARDVHAKDREGLPLLARAVEKNNFVLTTALLAAGANEVNAVKDRDPLVVLAAVRNKNATLVRVLLDHGAAIRLPDPHTEHLLPYAACPGDWPLFLRVFKLAGPRPEKEDLYHALSNATSEGDRRVVSFLLDHGAPFTIPDLGNEFAPLIVAADAGDAGMVDFLISRGADTEVSERFGTALTHAAERGYLQVVKRLLARGANPTADSYGGTPLTMAASRKHLEIVRALLAAGADVNQKGNHGETALGDAEYNDDPAMVKLLKDAGAREVERLR